MLPDSDAIASYPAWNCTPQAGLGEAVIRQCYLQRVTSSRFAHILGSVAFLNQETEPLTMNLQHHFLIAMPALQDPIFRRSVVYICEHNENGAMGIIVNKPLENLQIEGILEKLKITPEVRDPAIRLDKPVMLGGPLA